MPRNTREWARRKIDMAVGNLDWLDRHLLEVAKRYQEAHPEIAKPLVEITVGTVLMRKVIARIKDRI